MTERLYSINPDHLSTLKSLINDSSTPFIKRSLVSASDLPKISDADIGVNKVILTTDVISGRVYKGYLVYEKPVGEDPLCFYIAFNSSKDKDLTLLVLNVEQETLEIFNEDLTIEELRRTSGEAVGVSGGGGGEPAAYLKSITKDNVNQEITIKDKNNNETKFPYGGGEPTAFLKSITKDTVNQKITITDKNDNATEFPYGGAGASESQDVELTSPADESVSGDALDQAVANEQFVEKLDEHENKIAALSGRGRFLSLWNATTGKPVTDPTDLPYTYKAGDYYVVSAVGTTNYRPTGSSYDGTASTTQETSELAVNDTYLFDGTNWLLQKEVASGSLTPAQLSNMMEGSTEVIVDLNATNTKVKVDLHAKEVVISAPSTATSGTLTDVQLAALKESVNSYIVFDNEIYKLNDNGHVSGSLGYTHTGVENGVFITKNITITESTLGWVLTEKAEDIDFAVIMQPLNPQITALQITSNNIADEIYDYVTENGKMPRVVGLVDAGTDKYWVMLSQMELLDGDEAVLYGEDKNLFTNGYSSLTVKVTMETGHTGTTDGQSVTLYKYRFYQFDETLTTTEITVDGIDVPELTASKVDEIVGNLVTGIKCFIRIVTLTKSQMFEIIDGGNDTTLGKNNFFSITINNAKVTYRSDLDGLKIEVKRGSRLIEVHQASDLPTTPNTDGDVKIVMCDNGLLPDPTDQLAGYIYEELEA